MELVTLVTPGTLKTRGAVTRSGHWVAELVCLRTLAHLVAVVTEGAWKTSWWSGDEEEEKVRGGREKEEKEEEEREAELQEEDFRVAAERRRLTLFAAVPHQTWTTAALPGDVVAGRALRTVAAPPAVRPVRAGQTC